MRLLANENFPGDAVEALRRQGHDVFRVRTEAPGPRDKEVLELAQTQDRILLTFDKDFGELAFKHGLPARCGVVLFRIFVPSPEVAARKVVTALASRADRGGAFAVVEEHRIRLRRLPG